MERVASHLDRNEIACTLRRVNKAAAAQFRGPEHTTVRLSQPVPPHAFAEHWLAPGSTRGLTYLQRCTLLRLTAASGVVANLEVAMRATGSENSGLGFWTAAVAGKLNVCQWLLERNSAAALIGPVGGAILNDVAYRGHRHMCEWLLSLKVPWSIVDGASGAASGGHIELMEWLLVRWPQPRLSRSLARLILAAATGCDLATLQRFWRDGGQGLALEDKKQALANAIGSLTPDWAAKVEWLEAQGCPRSVKVAQWAATCRRDAPARLAWMWARGDILGVAAVRAAAGADNLAALQYLLTEVGIQPPDNKYHGADTDAAREGHLAAVQALHSAGWPLDAFGDGRLAAQGPHLSLLAWLVETLGEEAVRLDASLFKAAAKSGSVELLAWLRERGCEWDAEAYTCAADAGCVAALEWLVERGCPMSEGGWPFTAACRNSDMLTARCLLRLGFTWGDGVKAFEGALAASPLSMIRWMLEEGFPAGKFGKSWVEKCVQYRPASERDQILRLLEEHRQRVGPGS
ncbi:hypothetical protein GPECTOR_73g661 [Gonium pectorale]|uniref:Uncharacterized protein n=1 Tax=Gonium pectorale TaxID=33097 RepID=A0A150G4B8_GONPE|nr:hypothetical protein GPECTOR_73g661 [Gonium pectorale]|eukprot:KXZ44140.1 hypothetical protein GPECTOR_73g661 [Gonium pectorale]